MLLTRRAALAAAVAAGLPEMADAGTPQLSFAAVFPFSGESALLGDESFRGLALAVDSRNQAGGLLGRQIQLIRKDARDRDQAEAVTKALTNPPQAAAIFGTAVTPIALAASAVAGVVGAPYFELTAIGEPITKRGLQFLFRSCPEATAFAELSVTTVSDLLAPHWQCAAGSLRLGVLAVSSDSGAAMAATQAGACKRHGLTLSQTLAYPPNTLDFGPLIRALRGARIDVLLHTGFANDIVLLFRGMQDAHWRPRMVIGLGPAYALADTRQAVGSALDGTLAVDFPPYATNPEVARGAAAVDAAYRRRYGAEPRSGLSLAAYAGSGFFFEAIARARTTEPAKLRELLLASNVPYGSGANGWGAFFGADGQNLRAWPVVLQWQHGHAVSVHPSHVAAAPPDLASGCDPPTGMKGQ